MLGDTLLTLTFAFAFGFLNTSIGNVLEAKKNPKRCCDVCQQQQNQ